MPKYFVNRTITLFRPPHHGGKVLVGGTTVELNASEAEEAASAVQQIKSKKPEVRSQKSEEPPKEKLEVQPLAAPLESELPPAAKQPDEPPKGLRRFHQPGKQKE